MPFYFLQPLIKIYISTHTYSLYLKQQELLITILLLTYKNTNLPAAVT